MKKDCPDARKSQNERPYFQKTIERYDSIDKDFEAVFLVQGTQRRALIDSGCVYSVCGKEWLMDYMRSCQSGIVAEITEAKEKKNFWFGDGKVQESNI